MVVLIAALCLLLSIEAPVASVDFSRISKQAREAKAAGRIEDAVQFFSQGVGLRPAWPEGWWDLGTLLYEQDRFPEAEAALIRFVALAPDPVPAYALLGLCEYETHHFDDAERHFAAWAAKKPPASKELMASAFFHWALLMTRNGRFEQALVLLTSQAKLGNTGPALTEAAGLAALRIPNLPEDYPPAEREPVWMAGRAELQSGVRHFEQADAEAKQLLLHYGQHPNVHYFLGVLRLTANDPVGAASEFQREIEISPRSVPALLQMAFYSLERDEPAAALPWAERAVAAGPVDFVAHAALGKALLACGRFDESARELEKAREIAPDSPDVRWTLSRAYDALGRHNEAERERAVFTRLKPRTPQEQARP